MIRINRPKRSEILAKWKIILLVVALVSSAFIAGAYANLVVVRNIQSLAGNHVLVPAPELQILNTFWIIDLNSSTIKGVILNITTTAPSGTPIVVKLYQIFIQVSCIDTTLATGTEFTCTTGTTIIALPSNLNGNHVIVRVSFSPPIDPELIEVHDLSFIVTGTPCTTIGCP